VRPEEYVRGVSSGEDWEGNAAHTSQTNSVESLSALDFSGTFLSLKKYLLASVF
jgi:hypothetical protein